MNADAERISLTDQIDVANGAHILYCYSSMEGYLDNAAAFIAAGLHLGQGVVVIDSPENYESIQARLSVRTRESCAEKVVFVDRFQFYCEQGKLQFDAVLRNMDDLFRSLQHRYVAIRAWGHVYRDGWEDFFARLQLYERLGDEALRVKKVVAICVYDGRRMTAHEQNELLRSHEYFMTDTTLTKSMLYEAEDLNVVYPSLSGLTQMQSEMDLYKQKIDFVHAVSHEVRNPLTIIKAYASMLKDNQAGPEESRKLKMIADYADLIDNEITHIINTEQMLLTESLWSTTVIDVMPVLTEAVSIMATKARTQGIHFESRLELVRVAIVGNAVGFRLIVSNLLSNAIKYSEEGGLVRIDARTEGGELVMVIADNGIGMNAEQTQKLFRKYEKMNEERSGQGIGLFMVKKLVDHFGGGIEVRSELGKGTVMTVRLPLYRAMEAAP
jgi:signal transduction histidine kinase